MKTTKPELLSRVLTYEPMPALFVMVFMIALLLPMWHSAAELVRQNKQDAIDRHASEIATHIEARMFRYRDILRTSQALLIGDAPITPLTWRNFVSTLNLEDRHPAVVGAGFVPIVERGDEGQLIEQVRSFSGHEDFDIRPQSDQHSFTPITYLDSDQQAIRSLLGLDLSSDDVLRNKLEDAHIKESVSLATVSDIARVAANDTAFYHEVFDAMIIVPVYSPSLENVETRELVAYAVAFIEFAHIFMDSTRIQQDFFYTAEFSSGEERQLLYKTPGDNELNEESRFSGTDEFSFAGGTVSIEAFNGEQLLTLRERNRPARIIISGLVLIFFVTGFIYVLTVLRGQRLKERQEAGLSRAREELIALASHQLRTPATGVKQYLGMLREGYVGELTPEQKGLVEQAYENNERQLEIVNNMLFTARLSSGNIALSYERLNLSAFLKNISDEHKKTAKDKQQKLTLKKPRKYIYIDADEAYLRMAAENIITNAIKYTPEKGSIQVSLSETSNYAIVKVADTGVGVSAEDMPKLFQKFSRIPNELTRITSGSGIGLFLSDKIISAHNGSLKFESEEGVGSTVTIKLPKRQPKISSSRQLNISQLK